MPQSAVLASILTVRSNPEGSFSIVVKQPSSPPQSDTIASTAAASGPDSGVHQGDGDGDGDGDGGGNDTILVEAGKFDMSELSKVRACACVNSTSDTRVHAAGVHVYMRARKRGDMQKDVSMPLFFFFKVQTHPKAHSPTRARYSVHDLHVWRHAPQHQAWVLGASDICP